MLVADEYAEVHPIDSNSCSGHHSDQRHMLLRDKLDDDYDCDVDSLDSNDTVSSVPFVS